MSEAHVDFFAALGRMTTQGAAILLTIVLFTLLGGFRRDWFGPTMRGGSRWQWGAQGIRGSRGREENREADAASHAP